MSDSQYLKLLTQAHCVVTSLENTIGHSVTGQFDLELPSLRYKLDQGVMRDDAAARANWLQLLKIQANQPQHDDGVTGILCPDTWQKDGHPFLDLYGRGLHLDFRALFNDRCDFVASADHFEVRIADVVASVHRRHSMGRNQSVYERIGRRGLFANRGKWPSLVLEP